MRKTLNRTRNVLDTQTLWPWFVIWFCLEFQDEVFPVWNISSSVWGRSPWAGSSEPSHTVLPGFLWFRFASSLMWKVLCTTLDRRWKGQIGPRGPVLFLRLPSSQPATNSDGGADTAASPSVCCSFITDVWRTSLRPEGLKRHMKPDWAGVRVETGNVLDLMSEHFQPCLADRKYIF